MKRVARRLVVIVVSVLPLTASAGLRETPHNLSPRRGGVAAAGRSVPMSGRDDLCFFCHTPHSAAAQRGLWNQELAPVIYKLYESSTTQAQVQQPTGSSRLCLSCHDGVIAKGGIKGDADSTLGTDLSDDHPVSFVYDQSLATRRRELVSPSSLTGNVRLDDTRQMQCTSCHDAHLDRHPKFLVTDPAYSGLCVTCHKLPHWQESAHATSSASAGQASAVPGTAQATVGQNGCFSCHRSHAAPHPKRLLTAPTEEAVCLDCHDGRSAAKDLRRESYKLSAHRVDRFTDVHDPIENPNFMPPHVECVDCHNPHQARSTAPAGQLPGPLTGVSGISIGGTFLREATFEYEVCLKCHGVTEDRDPIVYRVDQVSNVRLQIDPRNPSFHPVADVGRNSTIQGLLPSLSAASRTLCIACHNNDAAAPFGSAAPRGPHGSNYRPILAAEYHFDATSGPESYQLYALCYGCHDRNTLLNRPDGFPHRQHVVEQGASCAVCHDAHGSRRNAHLINFMSRDLTSKQVVTPSSSGQLEYTELGTGSGRCALTCHGSDHNPKDYPARTMPH